MRGPSLIPWQYAYLALSLALLLFWLVLAGLRRDLRRSMWRVSLGTMLLGLSEPLFVPAYWNPPTLFELARRTGFDLESLLFSFAIGGIVFAAYQVLFSVSSSVSMADERHMPRHRFHFLVVASAPVIFPVLLLTTSLNPIYAADIGLVGGFFATLYCRPDLWKKMVVSGVLFLLLYLAVLAMFDVAFPGYIGAVWNLKAISGIRILGVPLEELTFAFAFGLYWSSTYEHFAWKRDIPLTPATAAQMD